MALGSIENLNLQDVLAFTAVVEAGGVNAASRRLDVSRSVVSKRVSNLEEVLGVLLLHRSTTSAVPTEAGDKFYSRAAGLIRDLEDAVSEMRDGDDGLSGLLRLSLPIDATEEIFEKPLLDFAAAHPRLRIAAELDDRMVDLASAGFDAAIRIGRLRDSALRSRRLCESPRVLCAAPTYLERHGVPSSPNDLTTLATIGYSHVPNAQLWRFEGADGTEMGVRVSPKLCFNNGKMICAAAVAGHGLIVLPNFIVAEDLAKGRLISIEDRFRPIPDQIHVVYPPNRSTPRKVRAFIDHMRRALGSGPLREIEKAGEIARLD